MSSLMESVYSKPCILIVDDAAENLALMNGLLVDHYKTRIAKNGPAALAAAIQLPRPDLILLDVMMPGIDGYAVCRELKADPATANIPVIFLTARTDVEDEQKGFDAGCVDYVTKPISPPTVLARVKAHLLLKSARDFLKDKNMFLEAEVARRTREVQIIQDVTILAMGSLAETRDNETGNHLRRTQNYVRALAQHLKRAGRFRDVLTDENIALLYKSAPLHDIGKVGIPDSILLKQGRLTPAEFEIMKRHTTLGHDAIVAAEGSLDAPSSFLQFAREITYCHQEKWDGSGYPQGLAGEAIPLSARLMAVADVYDALISKRVYKPAFSHEKAVEMMRAERGTHFDPVVLDAFLDIADQFRTIAVLFADEEMEPGALS
ncbi:MAG: two-component system response regulator [Nevskiaceae bacterium]|jgi:putative two-component system response regulator|nr:two-component system response regulator [Nevskiaceae bacterium]